MKIRSAEAKTPSMTSTLRNISKAPVGRLSRTRCRSLPSRTDSRRYSYIEEWQAATVKSSRFYEEQSAPDKKRKCYFYSIDLQGRLFLEVTSPKLFSRCVASILVVVNFTPYSAALLPPCPPSHDTISLLFK